MPMITRLQKRNMSMVITPNPDRKIDPNPKPTVDSSKPVKAVLSADELPKLTSDLMPYDNIIDYFRILNIKKGEALANKHISNHVVIKKLFKSEEYMNNQHDAHELRAKALDPKTLLQLAIYDIALDNNTVAPIRFKDFKNVITDYINTVISLNSFRSSIPSDGNISMLSILNIVRCLYTYVNQNIIMTIFGYVNNKEEYNQTVINSVYAIVRMTVDRLIYFKDIIKSNANDDYLRNAIGSDGEPILQSILNVFSEYDKSVLMPLSTISIFKDIRKGLDSI